MLTLMRYLKGTNFTNREGFYWLMGLGLYCPRSGDPISWASGESVFAGRVSN